MPTAQTTLQPLLYHTLNIRRAPSRTLTAVQSMGSDAVTAALVRLLTVTTALTVQACRIWATSARTTEQGTTRASYSRRRTMTRRCGRTLTSRSRRPRPSRLISPTQRAWLLVSGWFSQHMFQAVADRFPRIAHSWSHQSLKTRVSVFALTAHRPLFVQSVHVWAIPACVAGTGACV